MNFSAILESMVDSTGKKNEPRLLLTLFVFRKYMFSLLQRLLLDIKSIIFYNSNFKL